MARAVCAQEGLDLRFNHLDTTSVALTGASVADTDAQAMVLTHGDSKDHRPDLQPAVRELMVTQAGGVPFVRKRWEGTTADIKIFQERAQALMATLKTAPSPRYLVADANLERTTRPPSTRWA